MLLQLGAAFAVKIAVQKVFFAERSDLQALFILMPLSFILCLNCLYVPWADSGSGRNEMAQLSKYAAPNP